MNERSGVIWCRVSSEEQKSGYSLDSQERLLTDFAKQRGIRIIRIFKLAESASTANKRREFQRMLAFVEKEEVPALIAEKIDRLTRNLTDLARIHDLMRKGLTVHFVREGISVDEESDPGIHLTFNIIAAVAAYFARNLAKESLKGMKEKAEQGGVPFVPPVGYIPSPDPSDPLGKRRTVVVDEKRAPLVAEMFQKYATGSFSLSALAAEMNKRGLTTRPALTWPKAGRGARTMTLHNVHKILSNPIYVGEVHWKGKVYKGHHTPLVTQRVFNLVQASLKKRCTYAHPETKREFTYRKWATCGECWKPLNAMEQSGAHNSGPYTYYFCRRPECGNAKHYSERVVVQAIEEALGQLYIDDQLAARIKLTLKEAASENDAAEALAARRLATEETQRTNNLKLLYQDRLDGHITLEQYKEKAAEIEAALDSVRTERERLRQTNTRFREEGSAIVDLVRGLKKQYLKADTKGKAAILGIVLDKVVLRPNDYYVTFREPFGMFFSMNRVKKELEKGE